MYLSLIILPLMGSLLAGFFGVFLGGRGAALVSTLSVFISFTLSCICFYEVCLSGSSCYIKLSSWFRCEMFDSSWGFYFDTLTVVMLVVILSVSTLVHLYSISYMDGDPHLPRFMSFLCIFTFFMVTLVTADNLLQMFFGWEGVGLSSYLLINFWFTRLQASKASIKAMLVNRVGDFGLSLGIMAVFSCFKSVSFATVFSCAPHFTDTVFIFCSTSCGLLNVICLLLFIGAVGKSAQLGLHTWLPDAMEGPTPVSALIHAATMVTAGVFLIARCSPLFEYAPAALEVVTFVGGMTTFFAATTGLVQNDLKRVIAYSTCSQLGYMVFACGISNYQVGLFHLMNHAFFKALLFLSAGSIIHALSDQQDMRRMGRTVTVLPFTYGMVLIGSLSLTGLPFLTGFYSKDTILELAFACYTINGDFSYWLGAICVLFTSYYSFRLLFLAFLSPVNLYRNQLDTGRDAPFLMALPLILLAFGSIFYGYLGKEMMIGLGTPFWGNSVFVLPEHMHLLESEYIPQTQKLVPLLGLIVGGYIAYLVNYKAVRWSYFVKTSCYGQTLYTMLNKRWLFDKVMNDIIAYPNIHFGYRISFKTLDKGCFEFLGPYGISGLLENLTHSLSAFQSGKIYHYAVVMLGAVILYISIAFIYPFLEVFTDSRLYFLFCTLFSLYNYSVKDIRI